MNEQGVAFIRSDTVFRGQIRKCRRIEVQGYVEGDIETDQLVVHRGGRLLGSIRAGSAEINGNVQGDLVVGDLMRLGPTAMVTGKVRYGQLAMEAGAALRADVRNLPPKLGGDLELHVGRGLTVAVTTEDLSASDADDAAGALTFSVTDLIDGEVLLLANGKAPMPTRRFTQADVDAGRVAFRHDEKGGTRASFDVEVTDAAGSSAGAARTVRVVVAD